MFRLIALALLLPALGLAACGGEDIEDERRGATATAPAGATTTAAPEPLSVEEYRDELRRQCEESKEAAEELAAAAEPTPAGVADALTALNDLGREYQRDFEALTPPERFAAEHAASARLGRQTISLTDRVVRVLREGADLEEVFRELIPRVNETIERGNAFSEQIGVPECVQEPIPTGDTAQS